jgi:uncharacterized protein
METMTTAAGVRAPVVELRYNKKDITAWISPFLEGVTYVDHLHEADGLEVKLDDREGRWRSSWYPTKGDSLSLAIGYEGSSLLDCGTFQIDEIELSGPPHVVTLRALSAAVSKALRTRNSRRWDSLGLRDVVGQLAAEYGLSVVGEVPSLPYVALAQDRETDLAFLRRLAELHGAAFSIRGDRLGFHDLDALDARNAALSLEMEHLESYSLRDKTHLVYQGSEVRYFDAQEKQIVEGVIKAQGAKPGDTLRIRKRAETSAHAKRLAHSALKQTKGFEQAGTIKTTQGTPYALAGNLAQLGESFGVLAGKYQIESSRHDFTRSSGYTTECEVRRVV